MSSFRIRNASNTGWIDGASAGGLRFRNASNSGWVNKTASLSGLRVRNATNTGWLEFNPYSISPSTTNVNEGGTVTYTVTTSGIANGTVLYWTNSGTTTGADFSGGANSGSVTINSNTGTIVRTLANDGITEGTQTIILNLRTGSIAGPIVATAATVTVNDTSTAPSFPSSMVMERNDLEFIFSEVKTSSSPSSYMEITFTLDTTNFWNKLPNPNDHLVFALDPIGDSSVFAPNGTRDHCGPITRHGKNMFDTARGFFLTRSGNLVAEHWFIGAGFGTFDLGPAFDPLNALNKVFTVRIRAGYRTGTYGDKMEIDIFRGTSTSGTLLTGGEVQWGWDYIGQHRFAIGAICLNFVDPNNSGCIESTRLGVSYGATLGISNVNFSII